MAKIEIIIPIFNGRDTLGRTLASLESQTNADFTVHIIDDCSTEAIDDIIAYHSNLNIKVTRNKENIRQGMSRQVGIDLTDADYIAFLDSDDVLMPYTVEMWHNSIIRSPNTDIFHSYFYEQIPDNGITALDLKTEGYTWFHGKLYKVSFIKKYDIRFVPDVIYMDDSFFNSICTELGSMAIIHIPMYIWINNENSLTRNGRMTKDACRYDFIHGLILSTEFLYSKGVKNIKHMKKTLKTLESVKHEFGDKTLNEYNKLLNLLETKVVK